MHTARIIAEAAGVTAVADGRLNDRDYGPQTGLIMTNVVARWGTIDDAPGVEPLEDALARARPALDAVLDASEGGPVVVVTYDAVIRPLIASIDSTRTELAIATGSWHDLLRTDGVWTIAATDQ